MNIAMNPLSLREVRRRCRECPVDIRAAERVRMIFAHPDGNTGVREILNSLRKYPLILSFSRREKGLHF
jgi:hypothetical protein